MEPDLHWTGNPAAQTHLNHAWSLILCPLRKFGRHDKKRQFFSRSHDAVIRVYDEAGNVIETHEHTGDFKEPELIKSDGAAAWTFVTVATVPVARALLRLKKKQNAVQPR